jgi:hypothetical protein
MVAQPFYPNDFLLEIGVGDLTPYACQTQELQVDEQLNMGYPACTVSSGLTVLCKALS